MRCPVCRANNEEGEECRRCKADLSLLFQLEAEREILLNQAMNHAVCGEWQQMLRMAQSAHELRQGEDTLQLLASGAVMVSDYAQALAICQELSSEVNF